MTNKQADMTSQLRSSIFLTDMSCISLTVISARPVRFNSFHSNQWAFAREEDRATLGSVLSPERLTGFCGEHLLSYI